jgi:hypothetical protein
MRYEPLLVACGQIAIWLSLLLIVSFYIRRRIGPRAAAIALPQLRSVLVRLRTRNGIFIDVSSRACTLDVHAEDPDWRGNSNSRINRLRARLARYSLRG